MPILKLAITNPRKMGLIDNLLIPTFFAFCCLTVIFAVMAYSEYADKQIIARSTPTYAVIESVFRSDDRKHSLHATLRYLKDATSDLFCSVDISLGNSSSQMFPGKVIQIVRTSPKCDAPLLVDANYIPDIMLYTTLVTALSASILYLTLSFRIKRSDRRREFNASSQTGADT